MDDDQDELLATASHDLRNPLATIKTQAQILVRQLTGAADVDRAKLLQRVSAMESAADRMTAQLDDLIELIGAPRSCPPLPRASEPVNLVELVQDTVQAHQLATDERTLAFSAAEPELVITGHPPVRLRRILDNLIGNAVKYTTPGGSVAVQLRREVSPLEEPWAVVEVADSGVGIPAAELPHVFDRYFRATNADRRVSGTGLGLTAVRQLVLAQGGHIKVEADEGHGSTFTVWLPVHARELCFAVEA